MQYTFVWCKFSFLFLFAGTYFPLYLCISSFLSLYLSLLSILCHHSLFFGLQNKKNLKNWGRREEERRENWQSVTKWHKGRNEVNAVTETTVRNHISCPLLKKGGGQTPLPSLSLCYTQRVRFSIITDMIKRRFAST